mmetsp:Transcript_33078/g.53645  ORF Transcript_33078/g.53645 Transcript_33078/m.53645 type:complete len:145 (+) Transcript_33078:92-526(+)
MKRSRHKQHASDEESSNDEMSAQRNMNEAAFRMDRAPPLSNLTPQEYQLIMHSRSMQAQQPFVQAPLQTSSFLQAPLVNPHRFTPSESECLGDADASWCKLQLSRLCLMMDQLVSDKYNETLDLEFPAVDARLRESKVPACLLD